MGRVQDKVVLLTGAASGAGKACALGLAQEGAKVVVADVDAVHGAQVVAQIGAERGLFISLDVASETQWEAAVQATLGRFGRLDGLVNGAAILALPSIEDTTLAQWRRVLQVNADGAFLGCRAAVAAMKAHGGSIVNVASTAALVGHTGMCAYSASKGAVTALTRHVASHCRAQRYRIRCNSLHPAGIRTPMTQGLFESMDPAELDWTTNPATGVCEPEDVAGMVLYLISDESRFVNGAEMMLDNALLISIG